MHEMSLCENIVQIVEQAAQKQGFTKVNGVHLEIGKLAGVEIAAMEFGFEAVGRNTILAGATLTMVQPPGLAWCMDCRKSVEVDERFSACPDCGGYQLQVTGGDQLRVVELEVE